MVDRSPDIWAFDSSEELDNFISNRGFPRQEVICYECYEPIDGACAATTVSIQANERFSDSGAETYFVTKTDGMLGIEIRTNLTSMQSYSMNSYANTLVSAKSY